MEGEAVNVIKFNVRGLNMLNGKLIIEANFNIESKSVNVQLTPPVNFFHYWSKLSWLFLWILQRVGISYKSSTITPVQVLLILKTINFVNAFYIVLIMLSIWKSIVDECVPKELWFVAEHLQSGGLVRDHICWWFFADRERWQRKYFHFRKIRRRIALILYCYCKVLCFC